MRCCNVGKKDKNAEWVDRILVNERKDNLDEDKRTAMKTRQSLGTKEKPQSKEEA
jgi:hypothetical protein